MEFFIKKDVRKIKNCNLRTGWFTIRYGKYGKKMNDVGLN